MTFIYTEDDGFMKSTMSSPTRGEAERMRLKSLEKGYSCSQISYRD